MAALLVDRAGTEEPPLCAKGRSTSLRGTRWRGFDLGTVNGRVGVKAAVYIFRMAVSDGERERWRLAQLYGAMADGEIEKLADDAGSLSATAQRALQFEIAKRGLELDLELRGDAPAEEPVFSKLVTIRQFRDVPYAYLAKGLLDSAGIEAFLFDENIVRMDWLISNFVGGVKLRVREEDAAEALELLLDAEKTDEGKAEVAKQRTPDRCPNCRSTDVAHQPLMKRLAYLSVLLGFPMPVKHVEWKCGFCGHAWGDGPQGEQEGRG
jgi:hypothetical protein